MGRMTQRQKDWAVERSNKQYKSVEFENGGTRITIDRFIFKGDEFCMCEFEGSPMMIPYTQAPGLRAVNRTEKDFKILICNKFFIQSGRARYGRAVGKGKFR